MGFPDRLLADHEKMVFDLRPHWIAVVPYAVWTILLGIAWFLLHRLAGNEMEQPQNVQIGIAVVVLAIWVWASVAPFLRWRFTHFVLTSDRLITRSGVIARHSREIPLERVNDITFSQSAMERMLGAGDLMIESAGERGQTRIGNIRKPEQVQLMIYKEIESNNNRMVRPENPSDSIPAQIESLARLRDQGAISETEFENKKQDLLKRL